MTPTIVKVLIVLTIVIYLESLLLSWVMSEWRTPR